MYFTDATVLMKVCHIDLDLVFCVDMYVCVRGYLGDVTTGNPYGILLFWWELYVSTVNFFKKEKYLRCLYQFGKSLLISWCQNAKHKQTMLWKKKNRKLLQLWGN